MRKILLFILTIGIVSLTVSCTTMVEKGVIQTKTTNSYKKSFDYINGEEKVDMNVKGDETVDVNFDVEVTKGDLDIYIEDESGLKIGEISGNGVIELKPNNQNCYLIIKASKAKGDFRIEW